MRDHPTMHLPPLTHAAPTSLAGFSVVLAIFPRMLVVLAHSASETGTSLTPLESFLGLHFGIWLAAIGISLLLNVCGLACKPLVDFVPTPLTGPFFVTDTAIGIPLFNASADDHYYRHEFTLQPSGVQ